MAGKLGTTAFETAWLDDERARHRSLLDSLTGLPRGTLLIDRTTVALARARRHGRDVALFVLDDPRFPTGAHDVRRVAEVLSSALRPDDTLARIATRQFAVVCNDMRADEDAAQVARRLVYQCGLVCGLGVALSTAHDTPEALIERALLAAAATEPEPAA
jgi:GGDEF domain-containing protein